MRNSYSIVLCLLLLSACNPLKSLQTVDTVIPCIGSVGEVKGGVFSKEFQKVGEPHILESISVSLQSRAFANSTYKAYQKYRQSLGKQVSVTYHDTLEVAPRFFQLKVTDLVRLKSILNDESNTGLLNYLEDDPSLKMLTGISFVAVMAQQQMLEEAQHVSLVQQDGHLALKVHNNMGTIDINMKSLQVFDFETSGFCWQTNKRNRPEIVVLTVDGVSCPRGTEKSADKLDETRQYLKL